MSRHYIIRPGSPRDKDFKRISKGILRSLKNHGPCSPNQLCTWSNRDRMTVGIHLKALVKEGLVGTMANPQFLNYYLIEEKLKEKEPAD